MAKQIKYKSNKKLEFKKDPLKSYVYVYEGKK